MDERLCGVYGIQNVLCLIGGIKLDNMGAYDNETLAAVQQLMEGSSNLYDYDKGYIDKKFASDLYLMSINAKKE